MTTLAAFGPYLVNLAIPGAAGDAELHEALVLGAVLATIGVLAHTVSRTLRATAGDLAFESANMHRVADALGAHLYAGERTADDVYVPSFIGPGLGVLSGGELPDGTEEALQVYRDRIHPEDRPRWDAAFQRESLERHVGGEMVVEHRVVGLDGVTRWVRTRTLVHRAADGRILMEGVANDVTEQVRLRQEAQLVAAELRDSERRFRVMIEHLPTGAIYRDGDRLYLNPAASQITGIAAAGPIGIDEWFSSLHGASGDEVRAMYEADRAAGFPVVREVPIRRTDGTQRVVEFSAYRWEAGDVSILHDVTDRVEAERARAVATRELRRLATTDPAHGARQPPPGRRAHRPRTGPRRRRAGDAGHRPLQARQRRLRPRRGRRRAGGARLTPAAHGAARRRRGALGRRGVLPLRRRLHRRALPGGRRRAAADGDLGPAVRAGGRLLGAGAGQPGRRRRRPGQHARRHGRRRRPCPVPGQAQRPRPAAPGLRGRGDRQRAGGHGHRPPGTGPGARHQHPRGRAGAALPAGVRPRRRDRRGARAARRRPCAAAGSAAGCTTSARSRSPTASWPSPAPSTTTSGR